MIFSGFHVMFSIMKFPQALGERLTERSKTALEQAETISRGLVAREITVNHLISALFQTKGCLAFNLLNIHRIAQSDIGEKAEGPKAGTFKKRNSETKISRDLEEVLKNAMSQAAKFNYRYIGTEHLLWALLDNLRLGVAPDKRASIDNIETHLKELFTIGARVNHQGAVLQQIVSPNLNGAGILDTLLRSAYENFRRFGMKSNDVNRVQGQFLKNIMDIEKNDASENRPEPIERAKFNDNHFAYEEHPETQKSALATYSVDLVKLAKKGKLDPIIGRSKEIDRLMTVLCRRTKNNPMLIGEPGVGKTAIVAGLAQKIAKQGEISPLLAKKHIYQLDLGLIVAGTMFRGEFEARFKEILREVEQKEAIIFIDEIHTIVGAGSAQGSLDAANILKPLLSQNNFQVIGATTTSEWRRHIEKDAALERRFQTITIEEPSLEETKNILLGLKPYFESHHKINITRESVETILTFADQYVTGRFFPDKAIDILDEACAYKKSEARNPKSETNSKFKISNTKQYLIAEDIAKTVSLMTHVPVEKLKESEAKKFLNLEHVLAKKIIGQSEAIKTVASTLKRARAGFAEPLRPLGSFLFLGPTGVGKTELAKVLAREVFAGKNSLIKIDMSEFSESHSIAKLIGSPPGYVGFEEGGWLTEKVRTNPYSVILFDEIEKAHSQLANILLQILEDGILTDSHGRKINFRNTVIILTSNIGTQDFTKQAQRLGFVEGKRRTLDEKFSEIRESCLKELRRRLRPELLARIDSTIVFKALGAGEIRKITKLVLSELEERMAQKSVHIKMPKEVAEFIAEKASGAETGARRVRSLVTHYLENTLAETAIKNPKKTKYTVTVKNGKIYIG